MECTRSTEAWKKLRLIEKYPVEEKGFFCGGGYVRNIRKGKKAKGKGMGLVRGDAKKAQYLNSYFMSDLPQKQNKTLACHCWHR